MKLSLIFNLIVSLAATVLCFSTSKRTRPPLTTMKVLSKHFIRGGSTILTSSLLSTQPTQTFDVPPSKQYIKSEHDKISASQPKSFGQMFKNVLDLSFVEKFLCKFLSLVIVDLDMLKIVSKGISIAFWTFAALSILGTWGVDTKPFLSALSISGLTIGFAAKDVLTNTFAGLFLLFSKPFVRGSVITTCGYTGTVQSVDLRYVRLEDVNNNQEVVLIPLSMVYSGPITVHKL